jgi:capsular exopolysaccharide synthesis family protein
VSTEPTPTGSVKFRNYLAVFKRQAVVLVAMTLLGAAAAAAYTFRRTPVYESTASVLVRAIATDAFNLGQRIDQQLNMFNQRQLVQSEPVAQIVAKRLATTATPAQLLEHVRVDVPANSRILRVHYHDMVPQRAQRGADEFAKAYLAVREADARARIKSSRAALQRDVTRLNMQIAEAEKVIRNPDATSSDQQAAEARLTSLNNRILQSKVQLDGLVSLNFIPGKVIAAADLPSRPASPNHRLDVGIGLLVGLFLGILIALVRDRTDDRLRGREDLAGRLDRPVLTCVPPMSKLIRPEGKLCWRRRHKNSLVTLEQPKSPAAASYRTLGARMASLASQLDIKSVMVVSAGVGEGKSTTAANLAVMVAESGKDVLLVSADLRRPRVHQFFGLPNESGLANLLADGIPPDRRRDLVADPGHMLTELWSVAAHLWMVLSGPLPPHPSALLDSDAMRQFLKRQRDLFDLIILDCPPALTVADALALAPLVDAVLVVADAKESDREAITRLRDEVEQVGGKIVGAVLNRSKQAGESTHYYYKT